ncbi:hypothetical protein GCM10027047_15220 [Rhodococcus aerolatus]
MADTENTDEMLDAEESLDSDEIGERAGDDGVDAPDGWAGATKFGTTAEEQSEGESLDQKLAEERPDAPFEEDLPLPGAATPDAELDESVDQVVDDAEPAEDDEAISDDPDLRSVVDS